MAERPDKPPRPDELPAYLADPLERQDVAGLEAARAYISRLLEYHEAVANYTPEPEEIAEHAPDDAELGEAVPTDGGTLQTKKIPCGKDCGGCPHGPYTYRYYRKADGSLTSEYVGAGEASEYA